MKKEKGAITLYVTIVCLFIIIIGVAAYIQVSNKQALQLEQLNEIEKSYSTGTTIEEEYKAYGGGEIVPIKTIEQLQKIGSNEEMYIDGKIYTFGKEATYVLEQDFEYNGDFKEIANRIKNDKIVIEGNDHKIVVTNSNGVKEYYTEESKYYIATNKYGYVLDGLELYYDGIDNTGTGEHSLTTTEWKDLSGNGRDGILNNFGTSAISGWNNEYLSFDGVNDWVNCGELNSEYVTLEAIYRMKSNTNVERAVVANWQNGGNGIGVINNKYHANIYYKQYYDLKSNNKIQTNQIVTQSLTYNGKDEILYIQGHQIAKQVITGNIGYPEENTIMAVRS